MMALTDHHREDAKRINNHDRTFDHSFADDLEPAEDIRPAGPRAKGKRDDDLE
jgi:hypothetical protein